MTTPRHTFTALGGSFTVDGDYTYVKELGQGAYGLVVAARHRRTGEGCAIKKITNINTKVRARALERSADAERAA
jgi:serine/threonine protein kinase